MISKAIAMPTGPLSHSTWPRMRRTTHPVTAEIVCPTARRNRLGIHQFHGAATENHPHSSVSPGAHTSILPHPGPILGRLHHRHASVVSQLQQPGDLLSVCLSVSAPQRCSAHATSWRADRRRTDTVEQTDRQTAPGKIRPCCKARVGNPECAIVTLQSNVHRPAWVHPFPCACLGRITPSSPAW
jgi:hypothetical protein